jgi:hypothetical protein
VFIKIAKEHRDLFIKSESTFDALILHFVCDMRAYISTPLQVKHKHQPCDSL